MGARGIRERADRLRGAPLEEVLRAFGATPDPHDRARWHTPKGPLSLTPPKFMTWHLGRGGGGAIDLVMHLGDLPFLPALTWLARRFPHLESDRGPPPPSSPPAFPPLLQLPPPDGSKLARVLRYLQAERRLPAEPLDPCSRRPPSTPTPGPTPSSSCAPRTAGPSARRSAAPRPGPSRASPPAPARTSAASGPPSVAPRRS